MPVMLQLYIASPNIIAGFDGGVVLGHHHPVQPGLLHLSLVVLVISGTSSGIPAMQHAVCYPRVRLTSHAVQPCAYLVTPGLALSFVLSSSSSSLSFEWLPLPISSSEEDSSPLWLQIKELSQSQPQPVLKGFKQKKNFKLDGEWDCEKV